MCCRAEQTKLVADAKKHVDLVETVFDFGPEFSENGTMFNPDTDIKRYSGDPEVYGDEIMENWSEIISCEPIPAT